MLDTCEMVTGDKGELPNELRADKRADCDICPPLHPSSLPAPLLLLIPGNNPVLCRLWQCQDRYRPVRPIALAFLLHVSHPPSRLSSSTHTYLTLLSFPPSSTWFLQRARKDNTVFHQMRLNWHRVAFEPGTFSLEECPTIEDAYHAMDSMDAAKRSSWR